MLVVYGFTANMAQSMETQTGIWMMMSFTLAAGVFLYVIFFIFYQLSDPYMIKITNELAKRRLKENTMDELYARCRC